MEHYLCKDIFLEVVIAPQVTADAREIFAAKKNLRVLETGGMPNPAAPGLMTKLLSGGFLLQDRDSGRIGREDLKIVSKREPSAQEIADLTETSRNSILSLIHRGKQKLARLLSDPKEGRT